MTEMEWIDGTHSEKKKKNLTPSPAAEKLSNKANFGVNGNSASQRPKRSLPVQYIEKAHIPAVKLRSPVTIVSTP